jgi:predicted nucleotidyltransferase component of viral defense system
MSQNRPRNLSASIRNRLLPIAKARGEQFELVLTRYAVERFLYRLSRSTVRDQFVLKGATLFLLWTGKAHRPTRDLDFLAHGDPDVSRMVSVFQGLCRQVVEEDGMVFLPETVAGALVREDEIYEGLRITLTATLGTARIPLQIDLGFGDAITPAAQEAELPVLLDLPKPRLLTYPRETVVAEKCQAMVDLGLRNSRLKDFYDLRYLSRNFEFDGPQLTRALKATFQRRQTALPSEPPPALTAAFYNDPGIQGQWTGFIRRSGLSQEGLSLQETIEDLLQFLMLPLLACHHNELFEHTWDHEEHMWLLR